MIYEIASFPIRTEQVSSFKNAFANVVHLLKHAKGYGGHVLAQRVESPNIFNLIVRWDSLEDHTPNFEASDDHQTFMMGLQEYLTEEPEVYHIAEGGIDESSSDLTTFIPIR